MTEWVVPQLMQWSTRRPGDDEWLHEIKFDGYRMHARLAAADPHRARLDARYSAIARAVAELDARQAYLDG